MWIIYAIGSAILAALVGIFGKLGLKEVDPTQATIVRSLVMAAILFFGGLVFGKLSNFSFSLFSGRAWFFIFLSALAGAASWLLYFIALKAGPASSVAVIDKLSVVILVVLAAVFLGEALTLKSTLGIFFIFAGSLLVLFK